LADLHDGQHQWCFAGRRGPSVVDRDGSVWVGTEGGLARLSANGHWQIYPKANIDVRALALDRDGSLWVGTYGSGLARLDRDGHWQTYTKANTDGGLPGDGIDALALGEDGSLWVGTDFNGLGNFHRPLSETVRIVEVIGKVGDITQAEQTVAVVAFDNSYLTQSGMFHYIWRVAEEGVVSDRPGPEIETRSSIYRATFDHDGTYQLRVVAVDRYGNRSAPKDIDFRVTLPKPRTLWDTLVSAWPVVVAAVTGLYAVGFVALLLLARRRTWALRMLSDPVWAKWLIWPFFLLRHVPAVQQWMLEPWFQATRRGTPTDVPFLDPPVSIYTGSTSGAPPCYNGCAALLGSGCTAAAAWERAVSLQPGSGPVLFPNTCPASRLPCAGMALF